MWVGGARDAIDGSYAYVRFCPVLCVVVMDTSSWTWLSPAQVALHVSEAACLSRFATGLLTCSDQASTRSGMNDSQTLLCTRLVPRPPIAPLSPNLPARACAAPTHESLRLYVALACLRFARAAQCGYGKDVTHSSGSKRQQSSLNTLLASGTPHRIGLHS